jgi:hypothetical protein
LKTLLQQGISHPIFGDVLYKLSKILGHFSAVFIKSFNVLLKDVLTLLYEDILHA